MKKIAFIIFSMTLTLLYSQVPQWVNYNCVTNVTCQVTEDNYNWIGTSTGLIKMNVLTGEKIFYNNTNSGLPGNEIVCIAIDPDGNKWISCLRDVQFMLYPSYNELVKFDGEEDWVICYGTNSYVDYINCLAIDSQSNLWIGTNGGGLIYYNQSSSTHYTENYTTINSGLPEDVIYDIKIDSDGTKWIGAYNKLARYAQSTWAVYDSTNSPLGRDIIRKIIVDYDGTKWIGCRNSCSTFNDESWTTHEVDGQLLAMAVDVNNIKWIGTTTGLFQVTSDWIEVVPENSWSWIGSIAFDQYQNMWASVDTNNTSGIVMLKFDGINWTIYEMSNSGLITNYIKHIYNNSNTLWFADNWLGIISINNGVWHNYDMRVLIGSSCRGIADMTSDIYGNMWFINEDNELIKFDGTVWSMLPQISLEVGIFSAIGVDEDENIWIGTSWGKLIKFDGTDYQIFGNLGTDARASCIVFDSIGNIWIGTSAYSGGLVKVPPQGDWQFYNYLNSPLPSVRNLNDIKIDSQDNLWIAYDGLIKFDGVNWTVYNTGSSNISSRYITSVAIDSQDRKWMSSISGLIMFDGVNWATYNYSNSGLAEDYLFSIAIDSYDNKWIGTMSQGVCVFNESGVVPIIDEITPTTNSMQLTNYPNPFRQQTTINFDISKTEKVSLQVFNIKGQLVKTLANEVKSAGSHHVVWNGTDQNDRVVSNGIYFYKMTSGKFSSSRKMILIK